MALNKVLGSFKPDNLLAANQELPAVADTLEIAADQFLLRGSLVNKDGVLVNANDMEVYAVLARACDTTDGAKEAPVYLTGEFNTDAVKMNENVDNKFAVCVAARHAGIFLKPHVKMPPCAPMTLRFKFSKPGYVPSTEKGTWKNIVDGIWDWTYDNPDWSFVFKGAFIDDDNNVRVIAAGDTSAVTLVKGMFEGLFEGEPGLNSYNLKYRNNITECVAFDISGCVSFVEVFTGSSLKSIPNFDFTNKKYVTFAFADTKIKEVGDLDLSGVESIAEILSVNSELISVGTFSVTNSLHGAVGALCRNPKLTSFGGFKGDLSNPELNLQGMFQTCYKLRQIDNDIDLSSVRGDQAVLALFNGCRQLNRVPIKNFGSGITSIYYMFSSMRSVEQLPNIDTHNVSNFSNAFSACWSITTIPNYDVSSAINVSKMFANCYNAKYGILEMYQKLLARGSSITNHADAFKNCGRDTEEGQAALAQIPASWGGLAEG